MANLIRDYIPKFISSSTSSSTSSFPSGATTISPFFMSSRREPRIHREVGPAIYYENGTVGYFWRGVRVPEWVVMNPERITLNTILKEKNIEVRRCLIERFGTGRFLKQLNAEKIHEDNWGILWKVIREKLEKDGPKESSTQEEWLKHMENQNWNREIGRYFGKRHILQFVQVKDASTDREYFIPVPSTMKRVKQAIAWTFKLKEEKYIPEVQT